MWTKEWPHETSSSGGICQYLVKLGPVPPPQSSRHQALHLYMHKSVLHNQCSTYPPA